MEKLTPQEEQAMMAAWQCGEGNVKMIMDCIDGEPRPPYTTLASTIKNLEKKGFLTGNLVGNTYMYSALISEAAYKKKFMSHVVKNYFDNSYKELVSFFIEQKKLSPAELKELIAMIEQKKK
jgi:BlaI family transcriptional regulator, penicillinase repressor